MPHTHQPSSHTFCVAPMMGWSDRHCRYLWRLFSKKALLYTEMVTTGALLMGKRERFLDFDSAERPLALQLGGSDPKALAECSQLAEQWGYDEVNLNCGCPSDKVQNAMIGACLMRHPTRVADCIKAMRDNTALRASIKHRIGVDDMDSMQTLVDFVGTIAETGCNTFIIHARKAWLQGLSPKQNREIPPLTYDKVYRLKQCFPRLNIIINGGIDSLEACTTHLQHTDGVMIGREAYNNPYLLAHVDQTLFNSTQAPSDQTQVLLDYIDYCTIQINKGVRLHHMSKHVLGLFQGHKGARAFRRYISENACRPNADASVLRAALAKIIPAHR